MPANAIEEAFLGQPSVDGIQHDHQRLEKVPEDRSKIGKWSLVALILNRTIGSGIFLTPHRVLAGTGCVGGALFLWVLGSLISMSGLYVWLECGLSMPQRRVHGEVDPRGVPRSGGEKNFLEFMFPNKKDAAGHVNHLRTTCSFAVMFILMYNLSGNALSFANLAMLASGSYDPSTGEVPARSTAIGIAIAVLSLVVLAHVFSRGLGLTINNCFAVLKTSLLLAIVFLGIAKAAGALGGSGDVSKNNFTRNVWRTERSDPVSWSNSLLLCMYCFSGFEQPFYVLAETKSPRKNFPKYTVLALAIAAVLFVLVNISYLLVVDKETILFSPTGGVPQSTDIATLFFDRLFQGDNRKAERAMAGLIAVSIFGNLWVMTFTAARVKQEIAKEGILPFSLYIASSYTTPYGIWQKYIKGRNYPGRYYEQAPTAAFALHWFTSVLLIAVTAWVSDPRKAYSALVSLYSYTIILVLGCWVSVGLLMIKIQKSWHWQQRRRYRPWLSPMHAIIYAVATAWLLVTAFLPPPPDSPYHRSVTHIPWYIVPAIGITSPLWGLIWYLGILLRQRMIGRYLVVRREAYWEPDPQDPGEYVEKAEIIDHAWEITSRDNMSETFSVEVEEAKDVIVRRQPLDSEFNRSNGSEEPRGQQVAIPRPVHGPVSSARRLSDSFDD
ncbi:hypothetical protein KC353_g3633 [Hortaea werneckii]|nr:hypothetical protein KC353_g3633 [Hortaea werneckii]